MSKVDSLEHTEGTFSLSTCVLAASVVTDLLTTGLKAALMGAVRLTGATKARGAKRDNIAAAPGVVGEREGKGKGKGKVLDRQDLEKVMIFDSSGFQCWE